MENTQQNYLYHYTDVSSLAMILKNKSIRFSPLTLLDDMEEEKIQDRQRYGQWVFVSSWTDSSRESIPMWRMYTSPSDGVRIRLPKNPFCVYTMQTNDFSNVKGNIPAEVSYDKLDIIIPVKDYIYSKYFLCNPKPNEILFKVNYSDDKDLLYPKVLNFKNRDIDFVISKLGIFKNTYWSFQNEWRYILFFLPISLQSIVKHQTVEQIIQNTYKNLLECMELPFNYYFLNLDKEKIKDMEITLNPQISDGSRTIVQLLVEKYNPSAQIEESTLRGKIK